MKRRFGWGLLLSMTLAWAFPVKGWSADVAAHDPWVREAPPMVQTQAAYMMLENKGKKAVKLVKAASPAFAKVEIHQTITSNGMAMMEEVQDLDLKPGDKFMLKPGGHHLMLIAPLSTRPILAGQMIPINLTFSDGSKQLIQAEVRRGAMGSSMNHSQHGMQQHQRKMREKMQQMRGAMPQNQGGMNMMHQGMQHVPGQQGSMSGTGYPATNQPQPHHYNYR